MFGSVGGPEIFMLLVLALVLVGPRRMPELGRALGRAVAEFRRATAEFRSGIAKEVDITPIRDARRAVEAARRYLTEIARTTARMIERDTAAEEPVKPEPEPVGA